MRNVISLEDYKVKKRSESTVFWTVKNVTYKCQILPQTCPKCQVGATLIGLPKPLRDKQPDNTNIVCMPLFGGCNWGFVMDIDLDCLSCKWSKDE